MKIALTLLFSLLLTLSVCAQSATRGPVGAAKAGAEKEEPPKIEGMEVPRAGGGFLGVSIEGGTFKISFYDAKKKPVEADMARAIVRWDTKTKRGQERLMLTPSADGKALTSPRNIHPPSVFKLFITLQKVASDEVEPPGESYVLDFSL